MSARGLGRSRALPLCRRMQAGSFAIALSWFGIGAHAEVYQWRDAAGQRHFGDRPPAGAAVERMAVKVNTYAPPPATAVAAEPAKSVAAQPAVVLYSASWCGVCDRARDYLTAQGVRFEEYDIEVTDKGARDFATMGAKGVPVLLIGARRLSGFSPSAVKAALKGG